jgi:hypothetical protein
VLNHIEEIYAAQEQAKKAELNLDLKEQKERAKKASDEATQCQIEGMMFNFLYMSILPRNGRFCCC